MGTYRLLANIIQEEIATTENELEYITKVLYKDNKIPKEVIINHLWELYERITDKIDEVTND